MNYIKSYHTIGLLAIIMFVAFYILPANSAIDIQMHDAYYEFDVLTIGEICTLYLIIVGLIKYLCRGWGWNTWLTGLYIAALITGLGIVWWIVWYYGRHHHEYEHIGYTYEDRIFSYGLLSLLFAQIILIINFSRVVIKKVRGKKTSSS